MAEIKSSKFVIVDVDTGSPCAVIDGKIQVEIPGVASLKGDKGDQGDPGPQGPEGPAGGFDLFIDDADPDNSLGEDDDIYFRRSNQTYYRKVSGAWGSSLGSYTGTITPANGGTGLTGFTAGDILIADSPTSLTKLSAGTDLFGKALRVASTGLPSWMDPTDPTIDIELFEDFTTNNTASSMSGLSVTGSSSGLSSNVSLSDALHPGVYFIQTGTSSASGASYCGVTTNHAMIFGSGVCQSRFGFQFSRLSTAAQEFFSRIGWYDDSSGTDSTVDGVYFLYDRANYGDFWVLKSANNSTQTTVVSSVPVVANAWIYLYAIVNSAGTLASYYVNGVLAGTISTNIPTGTGRGTGLQYGIHKLVGTGTDSQIHMDYFHQRKYLATARAA